MEPPSNAHSTLHTLPGVIDSSSHGTVKIMLQNLGKESITITTGQCIAQLICVPSIIPSVEHCALVQPVSHDREECRVTPSDLSPSQQTTHLSSCSSNIIPCSDDEIELSTSPVEVKGFVRNMDTDIQPPYNIYLTSDPFDDTIDVTIATFGNHDSLGFIFNKKSKFGDRFQLQDCQSSTPAARIHRWRSTLRNSFLVAIDSVNILHMNDIVRIVLEARKNEKTTVSCKFSIMDTLSLHPQLGVPIMHHDQLNIIATHLSDMKEEDNMSTLAHQTYLNNCLPSIKTLHSKKARKLTRRILKSQNDWSAW